MSTRTNSKGPDDEKPRLATMEQCVSFVELALHAAIQLHKSGGKREFNEELRWELWRVCRHVASVPGNRLAGLLAGPAFAIIPLIEDLLWKTEAGLRSEQSSPQQRKEFAVLAEQLDFALALIYRNLGYLISWRGQRTRSSDLFCEAWVIAQGNAARAARLIRRCRESFPENIEPETENIVDSFAWETYQRVEELDRLADEFPEQVATAAPHMHGWPMIRQRHHDNRARFESIAEKFKLGSEYPLDTSKYARFRPDTPMVRYLDSIVCHLDYVCDLTRSKEYTSVKQEKDSLRRWWRDGSNHEADDAVLEVLCVARRLPALSKATAAEWARKVIVPLILATDAIDYRNCKERSLQQVANQGGVKSRATFKSRLLAAVIPTLRSMARPG